MLNLKSVIEETNEQNTERVPRFRRMIASTRSELLDFLPKNKIQDTSSYELR